MLSQIKLRPLIGCCSRQLSTTSRLQFKFKLTEEMSKEYEEQEKAKEQPAPEPALHTKESSLIMGKVSHDRYKKVVKCGVPKHRLNEFLLMYVRENDDVQALDENEITKPGDWVLLRRDESIPDKAVKHRVERVVHSYGNWVDPLTGRRSFGIYYEDDWEKLERIKLT